MIRTQISVKLVFFCAKQFVDLLTDLNIMNYQLFNSSTYTFAKILIEIYTSKLIDACFD